MLLVVEEQVRVGWGGDHWQEEDEWLLHQAFSRLSCKCLLICTPGLWVIETRRGHDESSERADEGGQRNQCLCSHWTNPSPGNGVPSMRGTSQ